MTEPVHGAGQPDPALPPPVFFDPSFERVPQAAGYDPAHAGPVLLIFGHGADRAWVADAAVALATGWTQAGRRTVLADLSLDDPVLHERIGMANLDGVVDVFLYGASLARSARPVPGRGFYLIPTGTYTPEPEQIFRHPRWEKIVAGFREAQATLLLFAPHDAPGLAAVSAHAPQAIVLGERGDPALLAALPPGVSVRAWLTPPRRDGEPPARPAPAERFPEPEPVHPAVAIAAAPPRDFSPPPPERLPSAAEAVGTPAANLPVPDPAWEEEMDETGLFAARTGSSIPAKRRVSPVLLVLLVLALIAAGVYAGLSWANPALLRQINLEPLPVLEARSPASAGKAEAAPAARPRATAAARPGEPAGSERPYAVFVRAFDDAAAAESFVDQARGQVPATPLYVIPEQTQGRLYHKVYAGMLGDTAEAATLRQVLIEEELVDPEAAGGRSALIQTRPLAFELGAFATGPAAQARADSLGARGIPAYVVPVPYTTGERWVVYGGAFADSAGAAEMQKILTAAQVPARLVRRTGRPPSTSK